MFTYCVIDLETSIHNNGDGAVGNMAASPFNKKNWIVHAGMKFEHRPHSFVYSCKEEYGKYERGQIIEPVLRALRANNVDMLVGHNIKFDILYLLRYEEFRDWYLNNNISIMDTMLLEYIITGQHHTMASLDSLIEKYKAGELKDSRLKELWVKGVSTEMIDDDIVLPYLGHDVLSTEKVFNSQLNVLSEINTRYPAQTPEKMFRLCEVQMRALQATIMMEHYGMAFDKDGATDYEIHELRPQLREVATNILGLVEAYLPDHLEDGVTDANISTLLFGGKRKVKVDVEMKDENGETIRYKTGTKAGMPRTKKGTEIREYPPAFDSTVLTMYISKYGELPAQNKTTELYVVNDSVLSNIKKIIFGTGVLSLCDMVLEYRKLNKDISTYFKAYCALTWPDDGCIHHSLHHAVTATGRLSSASPNLQNVTSSD